LFYLVVFFIFFYQESRSFSVFAVAHNDRGYGLRRTAGEFPVAIATKEMRAQRLQKAH
jgi:GT2 family glycosyltransferase